MDWNERIRTIYEYSFVNEIIYEVTKAKLFNDVLIVASQKVHLSDIKIENGMRAFKDYNIQNGLLV